MMIGSSNTNKMCERYIIKWGKFKNF